MVQCFAADCNHNSEREECPMFRFPWSKKLHLRKWIDLCRRQDTQPTKGSRLCGCHFKRVDGIREDIQSLFKYNVDKRFQFESPEKRQKKSLQKPKEKVEKTPNNREDLLPPGQQPLPIEGESTAEDNTLTIGDLKREHEATVFKLKGEKMLLQLELERVKKELESALRGKEHQKIAFGYFHLKRDSSVLKHYTGIPSTDAFEMLLAFCTKVPFNYYDNWRVQSLTQEDQLLVCLMKLRRNFSHTDLQVRFSVSKATIKNIVLTWLHVLHEVLYTGILRGGGIPSLSKNKKSMPKCFSDFRNCRIVYDCTEIQTAVPRSSMSAQSSTFSHYKQRNTMKALVGVAPNGTITFVSDLYPGSFSDKEIVRQSNALADLQPGDMIMADKGFLVQEMLPTGVSLNIPPFLSTPQFTKDQVIMTTKIARARIHVERAMEKIKQFLVLDFIPAHYRPVCTKVFQVCACLVNLQNPLLREVEDTLLGE